MNDRPFLKLGIFLLIIFVIYLNVRIFTGVTSRIESYEEIYDNNTSGEIATNNEYDTKFEKIVINSAASDININKSKNEKTQLEIYAKDEYTNIDTENGILSITIKEEECTGFCFNVNDNVIELSLPNNYEGEIIIDNAYGDITIDTSYNLKIDNDYGNITIDSANNYFDIKTGFGDIEIETLNITKSSQVATSYGDIEIGKTNDINITAKTDLGDTYVKNNNSKSDINLKLNTSFGDIKVNN